MCSGELCILGCCLQEDYVEEVCMLRMSACCGGVYIVDR